jgi:hypothetical protein
MDKTYRISTVAKGQERTTELNKIPHITLVLWEYITLLDERQELDQPDRSVYQRGHGEHLLAASPVGLIVKRQDLLLHARIECIEARRK